MPIVLAENFTNENLTSFANRYPGSFIIDNQDASSFPMSGASHWITDVPTEGINRLELVMEVDGPVFGQLIYSESLLGIYIGFLSGNLYINNLPHPVETNLLEANRLHFIFEKAEDESWTAFVFSDNGLEEKLYVGMLPAFTNIIRNANANAISWGFKTNLKSLVVAHNTPVGTRLSNIQFTEALLTADNQGTWEYSSVGFVEDTDKADPSVATPFIETSADEGKLTFTTEQFDIVNWYVAGSSLSDKQALLDYNQESSGLIANQKPGIKTTGPSLELSVRNPTNRIIVQADTSLLSTRYKVPIDDYCESEYTYDPATDLNLQYGGFGAYAGSVKNFQLLHLSGLGLRPFTIECALGVNYSNSTQVATIGLRFGSSPSNGSLIQWSRATNGTVSVNINGAVAGSQTASGVIRVTMVYIPTNGNTGTTYGFVNGNRVEAITRPATIFDYLRIYKDTNSIGAVGNIRITEGAIYPNALTCPVPTLPYPKP